MNKCCGTCINIEEIDGIDDRFLCLLIDDIVCFEECCDFWKNELEIEK